MQYRHGKKIVEKKKRLGKKKLIKFGENLSMQIEKSSMNNPLSPEAESILSRLRGNDPSSKREIIPIVGMGGIGKTHFARYVCKHPSLDGHFGIPAWVTISQNYDVSEILRGILRSIDVTYRKVSDDQLSGMDEGSLREMVHKTLIGRKYLIVMDDMWHTKAWDALQHAFPDDHNGSRIVITTREFEVASNFTNPHEMQLMSTDESWELLQEKVFGQGTSCPPRLEEIGKLIAQKCRGLPLAIVAIAGVLSKLDQMHDCWENIAENVSLQVVNASGKKDFSSDILSLSYMHLPQHLSPCFLYMGCFPEDYEINVSELIRLWVGEEFVIPKNESKDMEELGYEYLKDLVGRNLVFIEKNRHDGKIKTVKIHDLLRDLCLRKCQDDNFLNIISEFQLQGSAHSHRLSIYSEAWDRIPNMERAPIDSILCFWRGESDSNNFWNYFKNFKLVRVLEAVSVIFPSYPAEVSELINLRYLAFTYESYDRTVELQIPESLSRLQDLQTIVIRRLWNSQFTALLPSSVWRLKMLRHIILLNGFLPEPDPCDTSPLLNLHSLSRIKNFKCSARMLEMLPNLQKLGIFYSYDGKCERGWSEYGLNNLVHLCRLEQLSFYVEPDLNLKHEDVSKYIAFPATLRKLTLSCCKFLWEDMRIVGSLPNLEVLKLKRDACLGTVWETTEGEFCQLKVLLIDSSTDLQKWTVKSKSHFPRLERLTLFECNALEAIPAEIGDIPTLQLIEVDDWNTALVESALGILEEQESYGNYELKVIPLKSRSWTW